MSSLAGSWDVTLHAPGEDVAATLDLVTDEPASGSMSTGEGASELVDLALDGNTATWRAQLTKPMPLMVAFTATADGDEINGVATVQSFIKIPFDGKRR